MTTDSKVFKPGYVSSDGKQSYLASIKLAPSFDETTKENALSTFAKSFVTSLTTNTAADSQILITKSVAVASGE